MSSPTYTVANQPTDTVGNATVHRHHTAWLTNLPWDDADTIAAALNNTAAQPDAVTAVLAEHRPDGGIDGPGAMCVTCTPGFGTRAEDPVPYPCPPLGTALLAAITVHNLTTR